MERLNLAVLYIHCIEVELAPLDQKMSCLSELDTFMDCFTADETVVKK